MRMHMKALGFALVMAVAMVAIGVGLLVYGPSEPSDSAAKAQSRGRNMGKADVGAYRSLPFLFATNACESS